MSKKIGQDWYNVGGKWRNLATTGNGKDKQHYVDGVLVTEVEFNKAFKS